MKLRKDSPAGMAIALSTVCIVAGALLGWVYKLTRTPIEEARLARQTEAVAEVLPPFDNNPVADAVTLYVEGDADAVTLFPATDNGRFAGAAVSTFTMKGFSGRFDIIVGFDAGGTVTGYRVMSHAETPGLGAKMTEWFASGRADDPATVVGRNPADTDFTVSKDGGDIDAITAATITSRAFLDAISRAHKAFVEYTTTNSHAEHR